MSQIVEFAKEIYSRFGTIKRARKSFLYTAKGVRITDLYQEGGRAILGWGGPVFTIFKNVLERGASGSYFTDFSSPCGREASQLDRAISALFEQAGGSGGCPFPFTRVYFRLAALEPSFPRPSLN